MLSFLKKAVTGQVSVDPRDTLVQDEFAKQQLRKHLAISIKKLQREHLNGDSEIERNDEAALWLCAIFEAIFLHGYLGKMRIQPLKLLFEEDKNSKEGHFTEFWDVLQNLTHKNILTELKDLSVSTEVGLCRAWIRLALNDNLMESYLDSILTDQETMLTFYSPNAFLVDKELLGITKELLQGIVGFQFHLNYNTPKLNEWDRRPLFLAGILKPNEAKEEFEWSEMLMRRASRKNSFVAGVTTLPSHSSNGTAECEPTLPGGTERRPVDVDSPYAMERGSSPSSSSPSTTPSDCQSPVINPDLASGNKLKSTATPWSGWSSAFEGDKDDSADKLEVDGSHVLPASSDMDSANNDVIKDDRYESFGALLSVYGENTQADGSTTPQSTSSASQGDMPTIAEKMGQSKTLSAKSPDGTIDEPNYEVIPPNAVSRSDKHTQFLLSNVIQVAHEVGLDQQSYQCNNCGKSIGLIYGSYRICHFDGRYYCSDCHDNEEHVIPGRILQNWDFRTFQVCRSNMVFLLKNDEEPMFNLDEINPTLYNSVLTLNEMKMIRIQTQHVKGYLSTCRKEVAEEFRRRLWPREYLCEDIHQYSLLDLIQVSTGQMANHLKKIVLHFTKHIYKCNLCSQKGFVCEICKDPSIIYPFEVHTTIQCNRCLSLYHKKCRKDRGRCPKCTRMRLRTRSSLIGAHQ